MIIYNVFWNIEVKNDIDNLHNFLYNIIRNNVIISTNILEV